MGKQLSKCCNSKINYYQNLPLGYCSNCLLVATPVKNTLKYSFTSLFLAILLFSCLGLQKPIKVANLGSNKVILDTCDIPLNTKCIFEELLRQDILFPEYAIKSSVYETGHFTSNLCVNYNNLFGIIWIHSKNQIGYTYGQDSIKFGVYKTRKSCIQDYKRLQYFYAKKIDDRFSDNRQYTTTLKGM